MQVPPGVWRGGFGLVLCVTRWRFPRPKGKGDRGGMGAKGGTPGWQSAVHAPEGWTRSAIGRPPPGQAPGAAGLSPGRPLPVPNPCAPRPIGRTADRVREARNRPDTPAERDALRAETTAALNRHPVPRDRNAYAAIDLGTNNCRLLIARPAVGGFTVIDAFSRIVRLGEGVGGCGHLADAAMDRTLAALRVCAGKVRRRHVRRTRAVATEACRRADNFPEFRLRVLNETGIELDLIPAEEEARLALTGCAPLLDPAIEFALVFDIGGGSTEVMWMTTGHKGRPPALIDSFSVPFGVVTVSERYDGCLPAGAYGTVVDQVARAFVGFERRHGINQAIAAGTVQMLGSSGTVTTLAGVIKKLPRYDRSVIDGSLLDVQTALGVSRAIRDMSQAERALHPCIGRDRADLVVVGCAILEAICQTWPVAKLRIADRGVREGILFDLMAGWLPLAERRSSDPAARR